MEDDPGWQGLMGCLGDAPAFSLARCCLLGPFVVWTSPILPLVFPSPSPSFFFLSSSALLCHGGRGFKMEPLMNTAALGMYNFVSFSFFFNKWCGWNLIDLISKIMLRSRYLNSLMSKRGPWKVCEKISLWKQLHEFQIFCPKVTLLNSILWALWITGVWSNYINLSYSSVCGAWSVLCLKCIDLYVCWLLLVQQLSVHYPSSLT